MDERLHKRWMAIAGLLVGLPTVAAGGTGAVLGLMVVWDGKYLAGDEYRILLLWSSAGIIGLLSWLWLSGLFLWRGVSGLRQSPVVAWVGLAAAARLLPYLLVSPVAGALADRVDRLEREYNVARARLML